MLLCAAALGLVVRAQDDPAQDEAKRIVLDEIEKIEREAFRGQPRGEGSGKGVRGGIWGQYNPDNVMMILPLEEKVIQGLDRLAAFVRKGLWRDAARTVQELMETFPRRVLQRKDDPYHFVGVKAWCESLLRKSPALLGAYRENYDTLVRAKMERALEAEDPEALSEPGLRYPLTTPGRRVLLELGARLCTEGRFESAAFFLERFIELYPEAVETATEAVPRLAVALARLEDVHELRRLAGLCRERGWNRVRLEGARGGIRLEELIGERLRAVEKIRSPGRDYPRLLDHFTAQPGRIERSGMVWRYPLVERNARSKGESPGAFVLPAVSGDRLIVNVGYHVAALNVRNGKLTDTPQDLAEAGRNEAYEWARGLPARLRGWRQPAPMSFYAVTAARGVGYYSALRTVELPAGRGRTVRTRVHTLYARDFEGRRSLFSLKDPAVSMLAPPEVAGESVYAGYSRREDVSTPPDTFVARLDRLTGEPIWTTFLCMNTGKGAPMYGPFSEAPPVVLTHSGSILFCSTNNGVVAALESLTGNILWMRTYSQSRPGFMPSPPIPFGDAVLIGGTDAKDYYSLDRRTGRVRWMRHLDRDGLRATTYLYGLGGGRLIFVGPTSMAVDAKSGKLLWVTRIQEKIVGKGALSKGAFYVPTEGGIEEFDPKTGRRVGTVMKWRNPSKDRGSLVLVPDGFVTVGRTGLSGFRRGGRPGSGRGY